MATISFARGVPAPECLPVEQLADCARAAVENDGATILNYGPVGGYGPLREWIAERHGVEPERVLVTNGSLEGLNLLLAHFAERGRILVEAPTYDRPLKIAARLGARVESVPQDASGLDGDVRFEGERLPTLHDLDPERVLRSSSFSKVISPGVRVGYFVLTPDVAAAIETVATNVYLTPSLVAQATVYEFLRRGNLERNLERVRALLRERRDAMLAALHEHFPADAVWSKPEGGYFLWVDFPPGTDAAELLRRAGAAGVTFVNGSDFFADGRGGGSSARLAYSY